MRDYVQMFVQVLKGGEGTLADLRKTFKLDNRGFGNCEGEMSLSRTHCSKVISISTFSSWFKSKMD